jgi:hypothetical protein
MLKSSRLPAMGCLLVWMFTTHDSWVPTWMDASPNWPLQKSVDVASGLASTTVATCT